jgi:hypothetical protein
MSVKTELESEFDNMMTAMGLDKCGSQQRADMKRAYAGGALVAAKTLGAPQDVVDVCQYAYEAGLLDRMPSVLLPPDRN